MTEPIGEAGSTMRRGASSQKARMWYPRPPCPDCGVSTRIVRRPTGEIYRACVDRIDCGYQEALT